MKLKIALCQTDVAWDNKQATLDRAANIVRSADADIAILPEMFSTGYRKAEERLADTMDGDTVAWLRELAYDSKCAVTGSLMMKIGYGEDGHKFVNRLLFATPEGELYHYDKRHLFTFSGEQNYYSAGSERIIINYKGFRILPLVCYDLRFPVWSRGCNEFDLMIYVASWDKSRVGVWDTLLKARAIENQCFAAGVNRVGDDPNGSYNGHSAAVDFFGNELARVADGVVGVASAVVDLDELNRYRDKFRAWQDGDKFQIIL